MSALIVITINVAIMIIHFQVVNAGCLKTLISLFLPVKTTKRLWAHVCALVFVALM